MKAEKLFIIFSCVLLFQSCISYNRKLESEKDVLLAEDLIKKNLSYTDSLSDANRKGFEKALSYINKAIALDSLNIRAYKDKQEIFTNLGQEVDTLTVFRILELEPNFAEEYIVLGHIYERLKKNQLAKEAYSKAKLIYLKEPVSDGRNFNLITLDFLINKDKSEALEKLKQFPIENPKLVKQIMVVIDDIEKEGSKR